MEILTSVRRLYIRFNSLVNDLVYSFGRAALLLLVEVQNHTVPVRERRRIRINTQDLFIALNVGEFGFPRATHWNYMRHVLSKYTHNPRKLRASQINEWDV